MLSVTVAAPLGAAIIFLFNKNERADRITGAFLGFMGGAAPISEKQLDAIKSWVDAHPRLVDTLGRWSALNTDGVLNANDYQRLEKVMSSVADINREKKHADSINESLRSTGIESASKKHRLAKIAADTSPGRATSLPSRSAM